MNSQIITVAADGSPASRRAFSWALEEAAGRGCGVEVVTVYQRLPEQEQGAAHAAAEKRAHVTMDDALSPGGHVTAVSWHVVEGEPVDVLVRESVRSALLVMGSHRIDTLRHNSLGSVADTCARMSECPVVIVGPVRPTAGIVPADMVARTDIPGGRCERVHPGRRTPAE